MQSSLHLPFFIAPIPTHRPHPHEQGAPGGLFFARTYSGYIPPEGTETASGFLRRPLTLMESAGACSETNVVSWCSGLE